MPRYRWTDNKIVDSIKDLGQTKCYSTYVKQTNGALWKAAQRHFGSWGAAVEAAGFDYETIIRWGPREAPNKGSGGLCTYPSCDKKHHANGLCQCHDNMYRYQVRKGKT